MAHPVRLPRWPRGTTSALATATVLCPTLRTAVGLGSLEYAVKVGAKLIVVLGHTSCGAVKGAIDDAQLGK